MTLTEFKDACKAALDGAYPGVYWHIGNDEPDVPGKFVWFNPVIGPGLDTEWLTDVRGVEITVAGEQHDYASAEVLAFAVDRWVLGPGGSRMIGATRVVNINRTGGAPYALTYDDADRTQFVCGYLYEVYSGLALN